MSQRYILRINHKKSLLLRETRTMCSIFKLIYRLSKARQILHFKKMDSMVLASKFSIDKKKVLHSDMNICFLSIIYHPSIIIIYFPTCLSNLFSFIECFFPILESQNYNSFSLFKGTTYSWYRCLIQLA